MPKQRSSKKRVVPYIPGYKPPTERGKLRAITKKGENIVDLTKAFNPGDDFKPIPKCESIDDWLAQYKEDGQTYEQFLSQCPWLSDRKRRSIKMKFSPIGINIRDKYPDGKIYILQLEDSARTTEDSCVPDMEAITKYCETFLCLPVVRLPSVDIRAAHGSVSWPQVKNTGKNGKKIVGVGIKSRYNKATDRYQINIVDVLAELRKFVPDDAICVVALTMFELYEDESDLFVAGMAAGNHRVAVFSLLRYDPNLTFSPGYWYEISPNRQHDQKTRKALVLQRSCKLVVHEICHLLGIDHCIFYMCCMNGAGHLEEDYNQPMYLCPVDLRKLHTLCGMNLVQRYQNMLEFFKKHKMDQEKKWVVKRLAHIAT